MNIIYIFGERAEFVAEMILPGRDAISKYDSTYGLKIRSITGKDSVESLFNDSTVVLTSTERRDGSIFCLRDFFRKNDISYNLVQLETF